MPAAVNGARAVRAPTVSVVVASSRDRAFLHTCLDSLDEEGGAAAVELVVARSMDTMESNAFATSHPRVRFVPCPAGASLSSLRAAGMRAASGDIVILVEDDGTSTRDRVNQLMSCYR
jgi:hypothetical protein